MTDKTEPKTIELWDGFEVEVKEQLMDDVDFMSDLSAAIQTNNVAELISMYMAIVGGEDTYEKVREHIETEYGYFSQKGFTEITKKIDNLFPKSGNRAQRRSWKTSV
jgi:hypothetical protein